MVDETSLTVPARGTTSSGGDGLLRVGRAEDLGPPVVGPARPAQQERPAVAPGARAGDVAAMSRHSWVAMVTGLKVSMLVVRP